MPTPYTVTRRITVNAPAERVHALIDDFHHWTRWSPWEDIDPDMQRSHSGPDAGVGAHYAWSGDKKAGAGSMTITSSTPHAIGLDLTFLKPFPAQNTIVFTLTPSADGSATEVTDVEWRMDGTLNLMMRLFSLVKSMDSLVGPDFEKGLRRLKAAAESAD